MYAKKLKLKLSNQKRSKMAQCASYARLVYNYGILMVNGTSAMTKVNKRAMRT
ncbi:hypothetical protein [Okeania sp. KiyG1]|uniref:hypothetical protein n=1 Tax=Okeania sp. KiyG1 TaxID=2720165 RepID=UPI0019207554|nr:hypothetical protein [Okeania sp. KiyG1]GFZ91756.1 hypothetical protein CYANOKiyG1_02180 [Okeania sp. KiyG1]